MKRIIALFLIVLTLITAAGCGALLPDDSKLQIICTVFPQYDWVRNIVGDTPNVEVALLMDSGADLHNYQLTVEDQTDILTCDLFIYIGGESDQWTKDALKNPVNKERKTLALLDVIEPLCADHDHDHEGETHEHEEEAYDEHLWLSLKNADKAVARITELLKELDPDHAEAYSANAAKYREKLTALDTSYQQAVDGSVRKNMMFADRFPFRYMAHDYGIAYQAAFSGCSAEVEMSFSTVAGLIEYANRHNLSSVLVTENGDQQLAKSLMDQTKIKTVLVMDSMQSVTAQRVENGETYLGIMEKNLTVLKQALS